MTTMQTYLVGGAVRDELLGLPVRDRDWVVVGATPEMMAEQGFHQIGRDFPVFIHPETHEEHALARIERKTGTGHTGFSVSTQDVTIEQDLGRRDLTINSIARDATGHLIDPFGGLNDLQEKVLRHTSEAFTEDPLRVLRVARFAARYAPLGFRVAPETLALMRSMGESGELDHLVKERVWAETAKGLMEVNPSIYFLTLRAAGVLQILMPEIDALFGIPQPVAHHPEVDTGIHTMMALDAAARAGGPLEARYAALVHDLGKAITPKDELPRHINHEARGVPLVRQFSERISAPKRMMELGMAVSNEHLRCHKVLEMRPGTVLSLLESLNAYRDGGFFENALIACEADAHGRTGLENAPYPQANFLREAKRLTEQVRGSHFIQQGLEGPKVGEAIQRERIRIISDMKKGA